MANREAPGVKTFQLKKKVGVGFGIALSGGAGAPPAQGQHDTGIYISDVVGAGPAQGKLQIGDKLIMVQGKSCMGMSRQEVVNMLRTAGQMVNLSVVRQSDVAASTIPRSQYNTASNQPTQSRGGGGGGGGGGAPNQPVQQNGHNHSYNSSNDKTSYFTDDEDDYLQKAPLPEQNTSHQPQHNHSSHHPPSQHNQSHHNPAPSSHHHQPHNSTMDHTGQHRPTLEANSHRSYHTMGPDGTVTLDVNEPEPQKIIMAKPPQSRERFGIQFGTQLVVRDVMPGSLADKQYSQQLRPGDLIVAVNGQDVSNLDKNLAMQIAAKNRNRLELLVKKKSGMTVTVPISASNFDQLSDHMPHLEETLKSQAVDEKLPEPRQFDDPDTREVVFKKSSKSLGIRLEGGNNVGIFIANIQSGSPAEGQGLRVGDKILEVNNQNFRYATHEEAIHTLMSIRQDQIVSIKVKHCPEAFDKCQETQVRDQFYIRTHFKFDGDRNEPQWNLTFNKGEVFLVHDTLYMGQLGNWQASRIDHRNRQGVRGIVPNKSRADMIKKAQDARLEKLRLGHVNKVLQRFKTGNTVAKHPRNNGYSSGPKFDPYERVCLREASFRRPIVFFGPVADVARDLLIRESQLDFEPCQEVHNANAQPGRKGVVKIQSINDIISRDKHAVLDVTPNAVEKLNYAQLYPICIYLKSLDRNRVKQIRERFGAGKKNPKKQIDRAVKLDRSYRHVFTDVLDIDRCGRGREWTDELFRRIHDQQHLLVWVSERHETVDQEEQELDNEQDRFSYVSAPASDYSVTTVGTELAHEHEVEDEEEEEHTKKGGIREEDVEQPLPKPTKRISPPRQKHDSRHSDLRREFERDSPEPEERAFGEEDLMNGHDDSHRGRPKYQDMATSPVHYPPPPPEETGPGRYNSQKHRQQKQQPPPINRSGQYDYPPVEQQSREPYNRHAPAPHNEEWPAPIDNSTMRHNNEEYVAPEPYREPYHRQQSPPRQRSPPRQQQQHPPPPNRFDPQAILAKKQEQLGNLQQPPRGEPYHQDNKHPSSQVNSTRAPQHQTKPLSSSNNSNRQQSQPKTGYYLNQTARPYQSSWNPHPKPSAEIPKGVVSNRLNMFNREVPPPVQEQSQRPQQPRAYSPPAPQPHREQQPHREVPPPRQNSPPPPEPIQQQRQPVEQASQQKKDVVATARGIFDYNGGVLSSLETGVSLVIPEGAIPYGTQQEIYFKVCQDENSLPTPANAAQGERLMSPMVMCGPHGLKFEVPIELRLPHRPERDPSESLNLTATQPDEESVSILIDHF